MRSYLLAWRYNALNLLYLPSIADITLQISAGIYWHIVNRIMIMVRGNLVSLIYAKSLELSAVSVEDSASVTLMSTDVENAMLGFGDLHETWANLVQIGIAMWLLELQISWACIAPIIISVGMLSILSNITVT